jgi:hypothetical protein
MRQIRLYVVIAAIAAVVVSPLLALAYFATDDGAGQLEETVFTGWVEPARDAAAGLLTFASANTVYATYTFVIALLFPAIVLSARATRDQRPDGTRVELWGWRISLTGYGLSAIGVLVVALLC